MAETLAALLVRVAPRGGGLRFVDRRERDRLVSWSAIHRAAAAVGGGLQALGIAPGQRVALIYSTGPAFFHAFFGVLLAGAVPVPLYPPARLGRLDEYHRKTAGMIAAAGCRLVLAEPRIKRLLGETIAAARPPLGCRRLEQLPRAERPPVMPAPDDLALVQFSSGTTVDPKPVALSHRAVRAQVSALGDHWRDQETAPTGVSWLPLYHDMGLIGCIFPALELATEMTLIPPEVFVARPAIWLRTIARFGATVSVAPNFAYGLCVDKIEDRELEGVDLSAWRVALNGAEAVAPAVLRAFQERFAAWGFRPQALTPVYGLSEASLAVTFSALDRPFTSAFFDRQALAGDGTARPAADASGVELASVGRPLAGFELRVADAAGRTLPARRVGRVWVRGPSLMEGYLDRPEATAAVLRDGWLDTGDLGFLDDAGELYLTGRAKDVVILRGRNHSPVDIEHAVAGVAGVRRGCTAAVSHSRDGAASESLLLFVEHARDADAAALEALPAACTAAVLAATGLRVDRVEVLPPGTLPRTSSGKLRRRDALERHLAGTLRPPRRVTPLLIGGALARSAVAYARAGRAEP